MKFRTRFLLLLAAGAAALTGCRHEEADYDLPSIQIAGQFTVDSETKKASVAADKDLTVLNLSVTATRDWSAEIDWDADEVPWIAVTPEKGLASDAPQSVKVTILDNAGYNRAKQVKFSINYDYKTLSISQSGEKGEEIVGTLENPFTVAGVNKFVRNLGSDVQSENVVYVKGIVSQVTDPFATNTFGNGTFYISDDGSTNNEFYCYRIMYLGNKKYTAGQPDVKVGDEVIICGKVVNYKGNTPETVQNTAFLYELNGENEGGEVTPPADATGTGTVDDPYNVAASLAAVKNLTWTSNDNYQKTGVVYVKGKISRIADNGTFGQSGTFGNASFYISDDGSASNELYAYRILYLGNKKYTSGTDIKVGDEVIVCGELMNYRNNTPETVANSAYLYSLNGDTGGGVTPPPGPGGDPAGTGTQADPYNVAAARNAVKDFTWTSNDNYQKTGVVYVKGKISRIADNGAFGQSGTYGNASFYISDDGAASNELYAYRILYLGNVKYTSGTDIKVGDEVVICGELMNYRGNTPETVANSAYLYSLNGSGGGGDTPPTPSEVKAVTIAEFNAAAESDSQVYELVGTIGGSINTTYGNFDLTDNTGTVYVYGLTATELGYGAKNDKSYASLGLNEGDKIKIRGYRGSFNDKIEVMYAWFIEKVGGDTPPTPSGGSGTLSDPYTAAGAIDAVKDLTWESNTIYDKTDKVYVKGKISRIANNGTYVGGGTFGNATYWISADGTEKDEFQIFRSLYFNGEKYTSGTDIKVGDEVIVYGALMNYKGNTPETVANENWLYSLNGKTDGGSGGGGTPGGGSVSFATNASAQSWAAATDGTYGGGFSATTQGLKLGYYKHTSTSTLNAPNENHVRVYKNSVFCVESTEGKKIKKIVIGCAPNVGSSSYCFDMAGLEGGASATADKEGLTVTWSGSASKVVLHANNGQIRMEKLTVEFE